jgi:hypothetical protein
MTIEDQIAALLDKAEPLRVRDENGELGAIVDQINALRALQASCEPAPVLPAAVEGQDAPKRRGRPPKVAP